MTSVDCANKRSDFRKPHKCLTLPLGFRFFSAKIKTREMLKTSKKAAPPVFRKVAWGRGLVGDHGVLAVCGFRKSLRAGSVL